VGDIEIERLGCLGHFIRTDDVGVPKEKVLNGKFDNARPVGKPRKGWEDVFRRDTSLGMREWRRRAEDREKLRRFLRDGRPQKGL